MSYGANLLESQRQPSGSTVDIMDLSDSESDISEVSKKISEVLYSECEEDIEAYKNNQAKTRITPYKRVTIDPDSTLLTVEAQDYLEKSKKLMEMQIAQTVEKKFQKEMYYGKRKSKIKEVEMCISSSQSPQDEDSEEFFQNFMRTKYGNEQDKLQNNKSTVTVPTITTTTKTRNRKMMLQDQFLSEVESAQVNSQKRHRVRQQQPQLQNQQKQKKQGGYIHINHYQNRPATLQENQQISQLGSDSEESIIVIKRTHKNKKRLRKMAHQTNRVKIQNRQNTQYESKDCPICMSDLNLMAKKKKGKLPCKHEFCLKCITQASRFSNRCPYCRGTYYQIFSRNKTIKVEDTNQNEQFDDPDDQPCYICGRNDDFSHLLVCEFCEFAYCHTYCDPRLNSRQLPERIWHCASCEDLLRNQPENLDDYQDEDQNGLQYDDAEVINLQNSNDDEKDDKDPNRPPIQQSDDQSEDYYKNVHIPSQQ